MKEHIVSSYDEDIKDLQEQVVTMGGLVEKIWMDKNIDGIEKY